MTIKTVDTCGEGWGRKREEAGGRQGKGVGKAG